MPYDIVCTQRSCHTDTLACIERPFNCLPVLSGVLPVYTPNANMKSMKGGAEPVLSSLYHFSEELKLACHYITAHALDSRVSQQHKS